MDGYSPSQMRAAYRVIETLGGYTMAAQAKRGEHTLYNQILGI